MVLVTEQGNYGHSQKIWGAASLLAGLLGMVCWLFPKDFYLPFLKTATVFSHLHLAFTVLGKAAFLLAGLWGGCFFRAGQGSPEVYKRRLTSLTALGFGFWTLSMFSGEIWSYRGWGLAVVWDDAVIVTFMATWFFFTGILHLYLTRLGTTGTRAALAVAGLVWVLLVNCWSDLGPYRPPVFRP
jgi:ABC-type transport system involved in cytochrome c biogenesis permease subunit